MYIQSDPYSIVWKSLSKISVRKILMQVSSWEDRFVTKNLDLLRKIVRIYRSRRGLTLIYIFLHLDVLCFWWFAKEGIMTTLLYISTLYIYGLVITNLPNSIFSWIYPPISASMNRDILLNYAARIHCIYEIVMDVYNSCFIRADVFSISGLISILFGILLISQKMPLYVIIHIFVFSGILAVTYVFHYLSVSKKKHC